MHGGMEPTSPFEDRSSAVARWGDCALQLTPCQLQNWRDVLLHEDKTRAGSESWALKQRRASRSFSVSFFWVMAKAEEQTMMKRRRIRHGEGVCQCFMGIG